MSFNINNLEKNNVHKIENNQNTQRTQNKYEKSITRFRNDRKQENSFSKFTLGNLVTSKNPTTLEQEYQELSEMFNKKLKVQPKVTSLEDIEENMKKEAEEAKENENKSEEGGTLYKIEGKGNGIIERETKTETRDDGSVVETTIVPRSFGGESGHYSTIEKITYPDGRVEEKEVYEDGTLMNETITDAPDENGTVHSLYKSYEGTADCYECETWEYADGSMESIRRADGELIRHDKVYTDENGNTVKEAEFADGSKIKTITKPDGSEDIIQTDANGKVTRTHYSPNDQSNI